METLENLIMNGSFILKKKDIKSHNLDAEILLAKVLKKNREYLVTNLKMKIDKENVKKYKDLIKRRQEKEPIAYIIKQKDFRNM